MRVLFTTSEPSDAPNLVRKLLEKRLIGCGNIVGPVRSLYWWKGEIQDDQEVVVLMETSDELIADAIEYLQSIHPYEVPKIIAWEPTDALPIYVEWLRNHTKSTVPS